MEELKKEIYGAYEIKAHRIQNGFQVQVFKNNKALSPIIIMKYDQNLGDFITDTGESAVDVMIAFAKMRADLGLFQE